MPASTVAFLSVDLTASAEQSARLLQLLNKFPGQGSDTNPKASLERLLEKLELRNIDIKRDVTSWLGTRVAAGLWVGSSGDPYALMAIASDDDTAAAAGLGRIRESSGDEFGFVLQDGYALVAAGEQGSQAAAEAAAAEAAKAPLSRETRFVQARQWLADDQVAVLYADLDQIAKLAKTMTKTLSDTFLATGGPLEGELFGDEETLEQMTDELSEAVTGRVIAGARIEEEALVVKTRTFGAKSDATPATDALARLGELPADSEIAAVATLPDDISGSTLAGFAMPFVFGPLLFRQPELTPAQEQEIDTLLAKEQLTEAEEKRLEELFAGNGGGETALEALTQALSGATVAFAQKGSLDQTRIKSFVTLATALSPEQVKELTSLSSEDFAVTVEGRTLTVGSTGFTTSGKLSADPLFQRAVAGAPADLSLAAYADLGALAESTPWRALIVMTGKEQGETVGVGRVLFG